MYQGRVCTWILALFHPEQGSLMMDRDLGDWNHEWHWGFSLRTWKNGFAISRDEDPLGHTSMEGQSQQPKGSLRERLQTRLQSLGKISCHGGTGTESKPMTPVEHEDNGSSVTICDYSQWSWCWCRFNS